MNQTDISVRGAKINVQATEVNGRLVTVTGKLLRVAGIKDEDYQEGELVTAPQDFVAQLKAKNNFSADVFTFSQNVTDQVPHFPYVYELDSVAVVPITSYDNWWMTRVSSDLRKDVRRSAKRGVEVRKVDFEDDFVRGIVDIYNELPIRHGRPFWHYRKPFESVKEENATYGERSEFIGAYLGDELIGFIKIVYVDRLARMMQIISKDAHRDKRPTNALIAKSIECAVARNCSHLTYGKFRYQRREDSLSAFKSRNGFVEILVPKYYVPLTAKGSLALRLRLHHGPKGFLPDPILSGLKQARAYTYQLSAKHGKT